MAPKDTFRIRAASLLHPFTTAKPSDEDAPGEKLSKSGRASTEPYLSEKPQAGEQTEAKPHAASISPDGRNKLSVDNPVARGIVRSVPGGYLRRILQARR